MSLGTDGLTVRRGYRKPRPAAAAGAAVGFLILIALGTWQVQRLGWKTDLIATLEARRLAPPAVFADVLSDPPAFEFGRAVVTGTFAADSDFYVANRVRDGRVGVHVVTPFRLASGETVLIDRGWVPQGWRETPPAGEQTFEGFVRRFPAQGRFTPDNDVRGNVWYSIDPAEMAGAAGLDAVAPVYLMAVPGLDGDKLPAGQRPGINLRNNHLGYAITWYGLAAALIGVFVAAHRRRSSS